ncbi:glucose transporter [Aureococcus anophagefferens]|uniref:Glucose transporter n=1 Tax=Aureococcus anophagefferens TaxID=44056 RepID=A0ABR1GCU5_AURAN
MLSFSLGPGPLHDGLRQRGVPTRNRAKSSALSCFLNRITSACVALSFLPLSQAGRVRGLLSYAPSPRLHGLYAATLPDTLGKSPEQIGAQAGGGARAPLRGYEVAERDVCADDRDRARAFF